MGNKARHKRFNKKNWVRLGLTCKKIRLLTCCAHLISDTHHCIFAKYSRPGRRCIWYWLKSTVSRARPHSMDALDRGLGCGWFSRCFFKVN